MLVRQMRLASRTHSLVPVFACQAGLEGTCVAEDMATNRSQLLNTGGIRLSYLHVVTNASSCTSVSHPKTLHFRDLSMLNCTMRNVVDAFLEFWRMKREKEMGIQVKRHSWLRVSTAASAILRREGTTVTVQPTFHHQHFPASQLLGAIL